MGLKIEKLEGARPMQQSLTEPCANCGEEAKCRRRDFSAQAWTVLLVWGEIQKSTVDQSVCDHCYNELRETLIDRADEIESASSQPVPAPKTKTVAKAVAQPAAKAGQKVRKAS